MKYDRLSFVDATRQGGGGKTERRYFDFAINDRPFSELAEPGDFIAPFGWIGREFERRYFEQLLLRTPSELTPGRVPLYICPECGDLACGCLTALVTKYDDCFTWSAFGFENNYEDGILEAYESVRDYAFQKTEYYEALNRFGFD